MQDSRDPRDAPANNPPKNARGAPSEPSGVQTPPQGSDEPEDLPAARAWAIQQRDALTARKSDIQSIKDDWLAVIADKRWKRLKAYDQQGANGIKNAVGDHIAKLEQTALDGADPETGEV